AAAVYLGAIEAAFSALMRLSLRLSAERSDRPGALGVYLDDPLLLFVPVRLLLGFITAVATVLLADVIGVSSPHQLTLVVASVADTKRAAGPPSTPDEAAAEANEAAKAYIESAEDEGLIEGEERRLLQSIVDFGDTLVREVMTPRPDIVAIRESATIGELRALFREQEYSRFPVFRDNLDNIAGFVFIKDLVLLGETEDYRSLAPLVRPAVV